MASDAQVQAYWAQIMARDSSIGRYSGPEQHDLRSVSFASSSTQSLLPFSLMRPIESVVVVVKGRINVTVAPYADISADAPQNLIQRFVLRGNHTEFGSLVPWDMSGAASFIFPRHFQRNCGQVYISKNGGPLTLQAPPSVPFTNTFDGSVATHDFVMIYNLPMTPLTGGRSQSGDRQQANYMLYRRNWNDSLQLDIQCGDASALGDPTGATVTLTGFQSASGTPSVQTLVNYGSPGAFEGAADPGVVIRYEQMLNNVTSQGSQLRLMQLQKFITNAIILRVGTIENLGQSVGITTFDTFDDTLLDKTQLLVDGKQIRRVDSNFAERGYLCRFMDTEPMQGHFMLNFIEARQVLTAYRGDAPELRSSDIALFSDVSANVTTQTRVTVIQEMVRGGLYANT